MRIKNKYYGLRLQKHPSTYSQSTYSMGKTMRSFDKTEAGKISVASFIICLSSNSV
jgi:hypothetical protein